MPSVVTSDQFQNFNLKKAEEKKIVEELKEEQKIKRLKQAEMKNNTHGKKKKVVNDLEEEWTCKVCEARYSSESIRGLARKWIECDSCLAQFHIDCVPRKHRSSINFNLSEEEAEFLCHFCVNSDEDSSYSD